jgi:DNA-binding response OmpR family regulator
VQENHLFLFGPYHFEPRNAQLRRGTCVVPLTRKACEVLQCLVGKPGQLVTKAALFEAVWPETVVSDNVLTNGFVKLLRLRRSSGKRVPLSGPPDPLGGPLRACHFGPTLEALPHLLAILRRR